MALYFFNRRQVRHLLPSSSPKSTVLSLSLISLIIFFMIVPYDFIHEVYASPDAININPVADSYVQSGSGADNNYGSSGDLQISPPHL